MDKPRPRRVIFSVSADDYEALERVRAVRGFRSHAEMLRAAVRHMDDNPKMGPHKAYVASGKPMTPRPITDYAPATKPGLVKVITTNPPSYEPMSPPAIKPAVRVSVPLAAGNLRDAPKR